jgi:predicted short-subunit dehydrogenase-like oxidoreductase (DUF2520 family)
LDLIKTITLIGAGNVATHLGKALRNKGFIINQVYSKTIENAAVLATEVGANFCDKINEITNKSDIYLVCIKDDAIASFLEQLNIKGQLIVHTSGSIDMNVFKTNGFKNYGILYPLQSFSKSKEINLSNVPFCIEANAAENENLLTTFAKNLSDNVHLINSEQRKKIHLAAVFACNFSNYMYTIANDILTKNNIDFELLKPLITETANKIKENNPKDMQTGPAKRNDEEVIKNHIQLLTDTPSYQDIYKLITENIIKENSPQ